MALTYQWWRFKGGFIFFLVWAVFEGQVRIAYRREIPCPHCGLDASWYQRDVKVTRRLIREFWDKQSSLSADQGKKTLESLL